ncbi:DUF2290 domain-containing protein [Mobilicoccus caccae]|uniref:DUF2290 domain-containing protein n=1 Tax=Mobilicoccus caccae TaxID=1859295 RepID=UPI003D668AEA
MCRLGSPSFSKSSPVTTTRALHQGLDTLLTALLDSGLALEINGLAVDRRRVTWQPRQSAGPFLGYRQHATVEQYLLWLANGDYCAVLLDGSLLQLTYDVDGGQVSGHRLAYIPCPYELAQDLLDEGFSIEDLVRFYEASPTDAVALRSPVRFDYDPSAAKPGHPASHFTINSAACRIACVAPIHMGRFVDFIFRHFYPDQHRDHPELFAQAESHVGPAVIADDDRAAPHIAWATGKATG